MSEDANHELVEKTLERETKLVCERCRQYADDRESFDSIECRSPQMRHVTVER